LSRRNPSKTPSTPPSITIHDRRDQRRFVVRLNRAESGDVSAKAQFSSNKEMAAIPPLRSLIEAEVKRSTLSRKWNHQTLRSLPEDFTFDNGSKPYPKLSAAS